MRDSFHIMQHLKVAAFYFFLQLTVLFVNVYSQCPAINGDLPTIPNGYTSNTDNVQVYSDGTAVGYYDVSCNPGYALNPNIGGRITCLASGSWSQPLPQCNSMGQCSISSLFNYLQNADGIFIIQSLSFIATDGVNNDQALGGSNITVQCADQYTNVGGSLTIVCTQANSWTNYPNCISTLPTTTTAVPPVRCPVTVDTWTFANGYLSNTQNIIVYDDNTAQGSVIVSCSPGYEIDSVSNGLYTCNGGTWSPRPYCTETPRCSLSTLNNFITVTQGLGISSQSISVSTNPDEANEVLIGSYILFNCNDGYTNTDNNLNVVCNADGQWTTFPSCIPLSTTIASDILSSTTQLRLNNNADPMSAMNGNKRKKRWIRKQQ